MTMSTLATLRIFARDARGGAAIELALGAVVLVSIATLCFDLYSRIEADTSIARMAVTMADFVSRETAPDGAEMRDLGEFLQSHELAVPADLVYVVTALHQPSGDPRPGVDVLWSDDTIQFGDSTVTAELAGGCAHFVDEGGAAVLPDAFTMADDEILVIAEVCARPTRAGFLTSTFITGDIYRLHALPARDPNQPPAAPTSAARNSGPTTVASAAGHAGRSGRTPRRAARFRITAASFRT